MLLFCVCRILFSVFYWIVLYCVLMLFCVCHILFSVFYWIVLYCVLMLFCVCRILFSVFYWTDEERGVIERSTLSGRERVIFREGLDTPTSLTMDHATSQLYWLGTDRHTIYSTHTSSQVITEVRREGLSVTYNDISVYEVRTEI